MARFLSLVGGAAGQFFNNTGGVLAGGLLYTYSAGTSTPLTTYTTASESTTHTNPIVLDSAGRVPGEIWLAYGSTVKFKLTTSTGALIDTWDNVGQSQIEVSGVYGLQELLDEKAMAATSAPLESPALTGTPTATTPDTSDESDRIATTDYVINKIASISSGVVSFNTRSGAVALTSGDVTTALGYSPVNKRSQAFTSDGDFVVPVGVTKLVVTVVGAGGGGGSGAMKTTDALTTGGGGGGGGAVVSDFVVEVTPEETISVTVGAGGSGGAGIAYNATPADGNDGQNGGSSSFGSYVTALGGSKGGKGGKSIGTTGAGGSKGEASSGAVGVENKIYSYLGTDGGDGGTVDGSDTDAGGDVLNRSGGVAGLNGYSSTCKGGGGGGASGLADGGAGGDGSPGSTSNGVNGTAGTYGSGGGGGGGKIGTSGDSGSGGDGGDGYVLVEWDE